jgi:AID/APOBEC-like deaminase family protein
MANEITEKGFSYRTPKDRSEPIIQTKIVSMGGGQGAKYGLVDPDSQGTTLLAKVNGYFFGFFQAGSEWGNNLGLKSIPRITDSSTVHAEEYFLAALRDSWDLLAKDGIIKEDVAPSITIKLTKTPCPGCAPQLVNFAKEVACTLRIKAAQLWGHRSGQGTLSLTALDELGAAGVTVIPWELVKKVGKQRKDFGQHELGNLGKDRFDEVDVARLQKECDVLRKALGLEEDEKFAQRLKDYKAKSLSKEAFLAYSKEIAAQVISDVGKELSKIDSKVELINKELEKASSVPARRSTRESVVQSTKNSKDKFTTKLTAKKQNLARTTEVLEKRKDLYESMKT